MRACRWLSFRKRVPNLTAASQNLYELIKGQGIAVYPDDEIRLAVQRAVAVEGFTRLEDRQGKASHKIDIVVALAQAALAAVQKGGQDWMMLGSHNCLGGGDGLIQWRSADTPRPRLQIRTVTITEQQALAQGIRTAPTPMFRPFKRASR